VRREAVELLGDPARDGFLEECLKHGLQHLLAADVVVVGDRGFDPGAASQRLSVTVDARCLNRPPAGTQVHALELIGALRRFADVDLRVLLPVDPMPYATQALAGVETIAYDELDETTPRTAIVHRPFQVTSDDDLNVLALAGERVVITHQDLIAYRNPAYHPDADAWEVHRRLTREALGLADLVVFESRHAADDALADSLVPEDRLRVVPIGVDHFTLRDGAEPVDVPGPFLLALGTNYAHKNLRWAELLVDAMRARGWDGTLVVAGAHADFGGEEPEGAVRLGSVSEGQKAWLYANAAAVVYPTTYEGFGLIPFEAALHGTPSLWAPVASLADWLPAEHAALVPWDAEASAERALAVIRDPEPLVAAVRAAAAELTWERAASELVETYRAAVAGPPRPSGRIAADALAADAERGKWHGRYWHLFNEIGPAGLALVGPDDALLDEQQRRTLAALAGRRPGRRALGWLLRAARGVSRGA
jgi:glycosyltransferase involved in cell wall biosynthesis